MPQQPELWNLKITCNPDQEPRIEEAFAEVCDAYSFLLTPNGTTVEVEILFQEKPDHNKTEATLHTISEMTGNQPLPFEIVSMGNLDWIKKVAEHLEPMTIARWIIYGAAFRDKVPPDSLGLQIDATSAFGTGEHPTTRGCLIMLDEHLAKSSGTENWSMLDMGCGSGILAMAFAKAGGGLALGIDMDEDSVTIARANIATNNLADKVQIENGTGYANPVVSQRAPYDLIMANVFADPLCEMAPDLMKHLKTGGHAILSGILNDQADRVISAHRQQGLTLLDQRRDGEWSVLALKRPLDAS